jgi:hypothetical protein
MSVGRFGLAAATMVGVAAFAASCSDGPTAPSTSLPLVVSPPPPPGPEPGPDPAPAGLSKTYILTISTRDVRPPCARAPEALKRRVYQADLAVKGEELRVRLSGGNFVFREFSGTITPAGEVRFTIRPEQPWDYDALDWFEYLPDGTSIIVSGVITARTTAAGIVGSGAQIRLNHDPGLWCDIDSFEMVPAAGAGAS